MQEKIEKKKEAEEEENCDSVRVLTRLKHTQKFKKNATILIRQYETKHL